MGVFASSIGQSPQEIHRLVSGAAVQHRPIAALYDGRRRLWCPHVLGYNQPGEWLLAVWVPGAEEALPWGSVGWALAYRTPYSSTLCRAHRAGRRRLSWGRSAERAIRQFRQHWARDLDAERGNRVRIMSFGADAALLAGESPAAAPGLIVQHGRRGRRGKNGSAR